MHPMDDGDLAGVEGAEDGRVSDVADLGLEGSECKREPKAGGEV